MTKLATINKVIVKDQSGFVFFDAHEDGFEELTLQNGTVMIFAARCNVRTEGGTARFDLDFNFADVGGSVAEVIERHLDGMPFCDILLTHHEADRSKRDGVLSLAEALCRKS